MGYPMTYKRVVARNDLGGDYTKVPPGWREGMTLVEYRDMKRSATSEWLAKDPSQFPVSELMIGGDLRRLEQDQRDEQHLATYAKRAGITPDQARAVLDALFDGDF